MTFLLDFEIYSRTFILILSSLFSYLCLVLYFHDLFLEVSIYVLLLFIYSSIHLFIYLLIDIHIFTNNKNFSIDSVSPIYFPNFFFPYTYFPTLLVFSLSLILSSVHPPPLLCFHLFSLFLYVYLSSFLLFFLY